jgi:hypothetical protein
MDLTEASQRFQSRARRVQPNNGNGNLATAGLGEALRLFSLDIDMGLPWEEGPSHVPPMGNPTWEATVPSRPWEFLLVLWTPNLA